MPGPRTHLAQVALPVGLSRVFTYVVPPELEGSLQVGHRVKVPFGPRLAFGYVTGFTSEVPAGRLRSVLSLEPPEILFTPEILRLTAWVADYYLAPWGQVLEAALPPSVRQGATRRRPREEKSEEGAPAGMEGDAFQLQPEQVAAAARLVAAMRTGRFESFLLYGVTGSGKTEVYLEAAEEAVREGGNVLFLVPEIAMGTQILARVQKRFAGQVGLFHSQTGEANRRRVWNDAREGRLPVVVGTRSAVFVPLPRLRLVVVDEEQEDAYKQEESPRYHGRDVAVYRARQAGAVVVLGSATPSLESYRNVETGKYQLLRLTSRIERSRPPRVVLVDLSEGRGAGQGSASGAGARKVSGLSRPPHPVLSPVLLRSLQERLDRSEQAILFLNRRGHSPIVQCSDCGESIQCRHCDVVMTFHKADGTLRCHYCNAIQRGVEKCPGCGGPRFFYGGIGTQKVEEMLRDAFPQARILRMDLDATRRRGEHGRLVRAMERGEVDILLGTQMVAKGFHFPRVTLVGVIQADREMLQPDFRASERAFRILTQVAGRAGRGDTPGEVVFQSFMPQHHVISGAATEDYFGFAEREMECRRSLHYPPFHRMVDLMVDGVDEDQVRRRAEAVRDQLSEFAGTPSRSGGARGFEILGPAPMPHARLKGRYRWHLTLKGSSAQALHEAARAALEAPSPRGLSRTRIQVDVDPLQMG